MKKLSVAQKKWLLSLHIIFSAIMLGCTVVIIILSITALNTDQSEILKTCYFVMHLLAKTSVRGSTIGTVVTGILLSMRTHWGFLKFYWIMVKEVLTLLSIGLGVIGFYYWSLNAISLVSVGGLSARQNPVFVVNNDQLWAGIILQVLSLIAMFVISVFKPWGKRTSKISGKL